MSRRQPTPPPKPKGMDINQAALSRISRPRAPQMGDAVRVPPADLSTIFSIPPPPAGVGRPDAKLAMDNAFGPSLYEYANQFGAYQEGLMFLGYPYLAQLMQRPEYRRPVTILAEEMTRKWLKITCSGDKEKKGDRVKAIEAEFDRLKVQQKFREAIEHGFGFGKGQISISFGESDDERKTPLVLSKSKVQKPIKELVIVEPMWTYPMEYNSINPLAADFYKPSMWYVMSTAVHDSRILKFIPFPMPDILKPAYLFGGLSLVQMLKPYVDNWLETRQNVNQIIKSFITYVLKTNMSAFLQGGNAEAEAKRAEYFNACKSNQDLLEIDKESEDFAAISAPLGSLDKLQAQAQEHMASCSGLPLVKFTGISPSGLNASSEEELRVFNDHNAAEQEKYPMENAMVLLQLVQLGIDGEIDPEIGIQWLPLEEMSEQEQATIQKAKADTDAVLVQANILNPEEARQRLADDKESQYHGLDVADVPEIPESPGFEDDTEGKDTVGDASTVSDILSQVKTGMEDEQDHIDVVNGDQVKILRVVVEHLEEDPEWYNKAKKAGLASDGEHWITTENGEHLLIEGTEGSGYTIKGGAGGKLNGQKLDHVKSHSANRINEKTSSFKDPSFTPYEPKEKKSTPTEKNVASFEKKDILKQEEKETTSLTNSGETKMRVNPPINETIHTTGKSDIKLNGTSVVVMKGNKEVESLHYTYFDEPEELNNAQVKIIKTNKLNPDEYQSVEGMLFKKSDISTIQEKVKNHPYIEQEKKEKEERENKWKQEAESAKRESSFKKQALINAAPEGSQQVEVSDRRWLDGDVHYGSMKVNGVKLMPEEYTILGHVDGEPVAYATKEQIEKAKKRNEETDKKKKEDKESEIKRISKGKTIKELREEYSSLGKKEKEYNKINNEGGEGYNPHTARKENLEWLFSQPEYK